MDARTEIREFLTSRRAKITPEQAGLATYGSRRVPGLRREEVAVLAGVSVPYYTRLERGELRGASDSVLEAVTRALQLDEAERAHLFDLARAAQPRWAAHNVRQHITGIKHFHHPVVGELSLTYDRLDLVADPGLTIFTYTAQPGSRDEETLRLLGSWAATHDETEPAHITNQR